MLLDHYAEIEFVLFRCLPKLSFSFKLFDQRLFLKIINLLGVNTWSAGRYLTGFGR